MLRTGDFVGRYEIERRLGHGGMGTLYLAHDPVLDRRIALKLLLGDIDQPGTRERFVREARAAAALSNPNIVTIYDYGDYASQPYIVMEYIHGETLAELIRRKAELSVVLKLRWIEELCSAVGYAHARGIIHRDLKPPNLMVDSYGRLKVLDFGIARMRGTLVTSATALIGTPGYCAPEQIRGGQIDHRSDLFSIGVVCYELLGYTEAFGGDTAHGVTYRILNEDPTPLSQVCPIDPELEAVVMKALQKPADERFSSADALREALVDVRVRLENESSVTALRYVSPLGTPVPRSATPARDGLSDGSKPESRARSSAAAAATPPPDPRRTDREIAARLRVTQVQEYLREGRAHLASGELTQALAACQQALKLDDAHPEVKELVAAVNAAALVRAIEAGEAALGRHEADEAMDRAREALAIDPNSVRAHVLQEEAQQILDGGTQLRSTPGAHAPAPMEVDPTVLRRTPLPLRHTPSPQHPSGRATPHRRNAPQAGRWRALRPGHWWAIGSTAALIAIAAGAAAMMSRRTPPAPSLVVIDAVPWATISSVQRETGELEQVPDHASTPLALQLVPGTYRVILEGPPPQSERRTFSIRIDPDGPVTVPPQRFTPIDVDEYFRPYVTVPVAPLAPTAPQPEVKEQ